MTCVFCELQSGDAPAAWVAREQHAAAFLTLPERALAPGHTLVVPTDHAVGIHDASAQSLGAVVALVQEVVVAMRSGLGAPGVNVLNASGPHSGQSVDHLHFHVVPRWPGDEDDGFTGWPEGRSSKRYPGEPGAALAAALRRA